MIKQEDKYLKKLEQVLDNYTPLLDGIIDQGYSLKELIIRTYKFEKPLSSLELNKKPRESVEDFITKLGSFFFVKALEPSSESDYFSGVIILSRFKNIIQVAIGYWYQARENKVGEDVYADIFGLLYGFSTKEIAKYCSKERLNH